MTITCVRAFIFNWIARYGIPSDISSDQGPQFTSEFWKTFNQMMGIMIHRTTTAFHPQANGLVERFHRHLKSALMARLTGPNWVDELPWVLLGIRTVPKEDIKASSAELLYGAPIAVPGDLLTPSQTVTPTEQFLPTIQETIRKLTIQPMTRHGKITPYLPPSLMNSDYVFLYEETSIDHRSPRPMMARLR
ncbi:uncharacterized protein LOC144743104 [Ciona intestinalis]